MTIPAWLEDNPWLQEVLEPWFSDKTRKGDVLLAFRFGKVTRVEQREVRDGAPKSAHAGKLACPDCGGPTGDRDYGDKLYCGACDRTWPRWKVERPKLEQFHVEQATPDK